VQAGEVLAGGQRLDVPVTLADIPLFTRVAGAPAAGAAGAAPPASGAAGAGAPADGGTPAARGRGVLAATGGGPAYPLAALAVLVLTGTVLRACRR
jgi:hypothetical protein